MDRPVISPVKSCRVKITLADVTPSIWRRLVLPGQWHLGDVHRAIQSAMGWDDGHLHEFVIMGTRYAPPDEDGDPDVRPEASVKLYEVAPEVGSRLTYVYDFGDDWRHDLVVESLDEPVGRPFCLAGRRACPPEDCGGPWGYADMLAALADPEDPEHDRVTEWLGAPFDAEAFDLAAVNAAFASMDVR